MTRGAAVLAVWVGVLALVAHVPAAAAVPSEKVADPDSERLATASFTDTVCAFFEITEGRSSAGTDTEDEVKPQLPYAFDSRRRLLQPARPIPTGQDDLLGNCRVLVAHRIFRGNGDGRGLFCTMQRYPELPVTYDLAAAGRALDVKPGSPLPQTLEPISISLVGRTDKVRIESEGRSVELSPGDTWSVAPGLEMRYWGTVRYFSMAPVTGEALNGTIEKLVSLIAYEKPSPPANLLEHGQMRTRAANTLVVIGPAAGDQLTQALAPDRGFRIDMVLRCLPELYYTESIPSIVRLLKDPDCFRRENAARALGELGARDAVPALVANLRDGNCDRAQIGALYALALLGDKQALGPIEALFNRSFDTDVRLAAAGAMGELGSTAGLEVALAALDRHGQGVQLFALEALGSIGTERAADRLRDLRIEKGGPPSSLDVDRALLELRIRNLAPNDRIALLRRPLLSISGRTRRYATREMAEVGSEQAFRMLQHAAGLKPEYATEFFEAIDRARWKAEAEARRNATQEQRDGQ